MFDGERSDGKKEGASTNVTGPTTDTLAHLAMHPAKEPQSDIGLSHGLPGSQQSASAANNTPCAVLAEARPPASGSMATAKVMESTKIVRKILIVAATM